MHDHRVDADLLQQGDVAAEIGGQVRLAHGVAAVFHHDGGAGVAAQIGQRPGDGVGLGGGAFQSFLVHGLVLKAALAAV